MWAIGDVHGCDATLGALLGRLAAGPDDHLVFVGDYIDRGPASRDVIERLLAMEAAAEAGTGPRVTFLRGNHDQMLLDWADGVPGAYDLWRANGGLTTLASYAEDGDARIPDAHLGFLRRTALAFDTPEAAFVHAGLDPGRPVAEQMADPEADVVLWTRAHLHADLAAWEKPVVCGHTPVEAPIDEPRLIDIDTGAVYHHRPMLGRLTAVRLPDRVFVAVPYSG